MEWIKIKREHISPLYTDAQLGCLLRYQLLVASLKRLPKEEELKHELAGVSLVSLKKTLSILGLSLDYIGTKVLEDVEKIATKRQVETDRKREYRAKKVLSHGTERDSPLLEKIR